LKQKKIKLKTCAVGGQALMEGVMMRGQTSMVLCVRDPDGKIQTQTKRLKAGGWASKVPILRGVIKFCEALVTGTKTITQSAKVSFPEEESPSTVAMFFAMVLGVVLAVGLFFLLPTFLAGLIPVQNHFVKSLIEGGIRLAIFVGYLALMMLFKDIRRTFSYHGAEHRAISCYEKGLPLTVENVQTCSTRHNRCGTTFLFFVMVVSILVFALTTWLLSLFEGAGAWVNHWGVRVAVRLALLPFVAGLSFELLRLLARTPDNWFFFIFKAPGLALQRLTTRKPDDKMCEVAIMALQTALDMEDNPDCLEMNFGEVLYKDEREKLAGELTAAGVTESAEVEWIMRVVAGKEAVKAGQVIKLTKNQKDRLDEIKARRINREPLDLILGYSYFYGHKVVVSSDVLLPRMETERVAEKAIEITNYKLQITNDVKVLDLCTGSGCIALSIAKATSAHETATDISEAALEVAKKNLADTNVEVIKSDLFEELQGRKFDIIISNPPYIASAAIDTLEPEVKDFQPRGALDGGVDGLDFYRRIIAAAPQYLNEGGVLVLEIGHDQGEAVKSLAKTVEITKDYDGNDRVAVVHEF